jgi:hypothetical protein
MAGGNLAGAEIMVKQRQRSTVNGQRDLPVRGDDFVGAVTVDC